METVETSRSTETAYNNFIDGHWVPSSLAETFRTYDPATGDPVSVCQRSSLEDMKSAIDAASRAINESEWSTDVQLRTSTLAKLAHYLSSGSMNELGKLLTLESGKPLKHSLTEYVGFPSVIENAAFKARFLMGTVSNSKSNVIDVTLREPVGVVGIIVPWNAPISLLGRSIAPALAAGCSVVVKPASATAGATMALIKKIADFGAIPKGIINCVTGTGNTVGSELAANKKVDMISFTGDVHTGKEILKLAAESVKKTSLELGGKSPNIVFSDANFEAAVKGAVTGACIYHSGQICFASTRILVERSAHDRFVSAFRSTVSKMKIGHGLDPETEIGPVVNQNQLNKVLDYIEDGKRESKLVMGGERLTEGKYAKGNFVAPTLFDDVPLNSKIAQEEIFGPVVTVTPFDSMDQAVEFANNTVYGLSAVIWSNSLTNAITAAKRTKAGLVYVNSQPKGSGYFNSLGIVGSGYKESGICSMGSVEEYTLLKRIHVELMN